MAVLLPSLPTVAFTPLLPVGLPADLPVVLIATLFAVGRLPVALMLAGVLLPPLSLLLFWVLLPADRAKEEGCRLLLSAVGGFCVFVYVACFWMPHYQDVVTTLLVSWYVQTLCLSHLDPIGRVDCACGSRLAKSCFHLFDRVGGQVHHLLSSCCSCPLLCRVHCRPCPLGCPGPHHSGSHHRVGSSCLSGGQGLSSCW
jgi:hypothetical protein